jgi:hypothetical protein
MASFLAPKWLFGEKPKVPTFTPIDPTAEQANAVAGNQQNLPGAENLASGVNQFNIDQLAKALQFSLPGGLQQSQANILSQLKGEIGPEASAAISSSSVAKGFGMGVGGKSGLGRNLVARDLGIASRGIQQQGFQNFLSLAGATRPAMMDPTSMFLTPQQRVSTAIQQNEQLFNRNWLASQIDAAPSPAGAFTQQLVMQLAGTAGKAIGAAI